MLHRVNPLGGEPLTGEPDAGEPPVRFGGRGNETNRLLLPLYQAAKPDRWSQIQDQPLSFKTVSHIQRRSHNDTYLKDFRAKTVRQ